MMGGWRMMGGLEDDNVTLELLSFRGDETDTGHDRVLFDRVRMVLGRDLEDGRDRLKVCVQQVPDVIGNVLVDEEDSHVLTRRKPSERILNLRNRRS